jgi:hypothetical protein
VVAWIDEGVNDMRNLPTGRQKFGAIEFDVIPPESNAGRSVLYIAPDGRQGLPSAMTIAVASVAGRSLYFLHTVARGAPAHGVVGIYDVCYADGTTERVYIRFDDDIGLWWGIHDIHDMRDTPSIYRGKTRVAWRGANGEWANVGMQMFGWDNPRPDTPITAIRVEAVGSKGSGGILLGGISISDQPVAFEPKIHSHGLPDNWAQAAVYYAVAEGLAGIEDESCAFRRVCISPRWSSSQANEAEIVLHYPASNGYCAYRYKLDRKQRRITLDVTGSFEAGRVHCLLPAGATAKRVMIDGAAVACKNVRVEESTYVDFALTTLPREAIIIDY